MIQQLNDLDRASPQFHEQFANFLRGDDYRDSLAKLQSDALTWFVEYLDGVSFYIIFLCACPHTGVGARWYFRSCK